MAERLPKFKSSGQRHLTERHKEADKVLKTSAWLNLRAAYLRANPLCQRCTRVMIASVVHHKVDRVERPDLALDWDNLEALCAKCHNKLTAMRREDG